jgi:hypothetical protein
MRRAVMKNLLFVAIVVALPAAAAEEVSPHEVVPFAIAGPEGFGIASADGASRLITHWLWQSDLRAFLDSNIPTPDRETFLLRFGGVRLDATLERSFRAVLFTNFAQNQVFLLEGWIEARLAPGVQLRAGKILYPISEERLTPGINLPFVSTSVAAMLLPARDTGVELLGSLAGDRIAWNLALTNGAVPAGAGDAVTDSGKDLVARLYVHPFLTAGVEPLRKLGLGLGASTGRHNGTSDNSRLRSRRHRGDRHRARRAARSEHRPQPDRLMISRLVAEEKSSLTGSPPGRALLHPVAQVTGFSVVPPSRQ